MCAKCQPKVSKLNFALEIVWVLYAIWSGLHTNSDVLAYFYAIFFVALVNSVCDKAKVIFA